MKPIWGDRTRQPSVAELGKARAEVVRYGGALEAYANYFSEAVVELVKMKDARTRPPWLSYRALLDELHGVRGAMDTIEMAMRELDGRIEAEDPAPQPPVKT